MRQERINARLEPELFGTMPTGEPVFRLTMQNAAIRVRVLTFGAAIQAIEVPDRNGCDANIALGLCTLDDYVAHSPHFGAIPGRYAGRIAHGQFKLDGVGYQLVCNNGPNAIHGGPHGFGKRPWRLVGHGPQHVTLELISPDGDEGYPGTLTAQVRYTIEGGALRIDFGARTSAPTIVNLTNHTYFNLAGEGSGSVLGHTLTIDADSYAPVDPQSIPTGSLEAVAGTPFDFRSPRTLGAEIRKAHPQLVLCRGYDHGFVVRGRGLRRAALLYDQGSGRSLTLITTEPAVQLYTANMLTGTLAGPSGRIYRQSDAVCLEAQHLADSPNQVNFPTTVIRPAQDYAATTIFRFGVIE